MQMVSANCFESFLRKATATDAAVEKCSSNIYKNGILQSLAWNLHSNTEAEYQIKHVEIKSRQVYRFYC